MTQIKMTDNIQLSDFSFVSCKNLVCNTDIETLPDAPTEEPQVEPAPPLPEEKPEPALPDEEPAVPATPFTPPDKPDAPRVKPFDPDADPTNPDSAPAPYTDPVPWSPCHKRAEKN